MLWGATPSGSVPRNDVEHGLGGDRVEPEHLRTTAHVVVHGKGVGDEGVGVEAPEPLPELDERARSQRAVEGDRRRADLDEVGEHGRVAGASLEGAMEGTTDEVLLPADPSEVAEPSICQRPLRRTS